MVLNCPGIGFPALSHIGSTYDTFSRMTAISLLVLAHLTAQQDLAVRGRRAELEPAALDARRHAVVILPVEFLVVHEPWPWQRRSPRTLLHLKLRE